MMLDQQEPSTSTPTTHGNAVHRRSDNSDVDILTSNESDLPEQEPKPTSNAHKTTLECTILSTHSPVTAILLSRQAYILGLVAIFASMFIVAWSILCWTSRRPIGRGSYFCYGSTVCNYSERERNKQNARTLQYVADAQTVLSAVSLLTIPLTSTVCAAAAVPWLQSSGRGMSLRQLMTLADKGWTSPYIYTKLLRPSGWKRYGSSFIALSLLLNILGAALSPAISRLAAPTSIKVPTNSTEIYPLLGLDDLLGVPGSGFTNNFLPLREALTTGSSLEYQPRLWQHEPLNCSDDARFDGDDYTTRSPTECRFGGLTYETLGSVPDAWISQLPNGFSVGVRERQYLPRVNSSVTVENVNILPPACLDGSAALVINHEGKAPEEDGEGGSILTHHWWIKACVPEYTILSPFEYTGNKQTISETLYLDLYSLNLVTTKAQGVFKITVDTTLGYFELPSYANGEVPGPLLTNHSIPPDPVTRRDVLSYTSEMNTTYRFSGLEAMENKGPLLNTVYALFGNGSMPAIYAQENATYNPGSSELCLDSVPLVHLFDAIAPVGPDRNYATYNSDCLRSNDLEMGIQMHYFIENFFIPSPQMVARIFRVAAYMSHSIWLQGNGHRGYLTINYDKGVDLQKPGLSTGSIIGVSLAISVFLLALTMLAFYASVRRTWTWSLDSYALLRIGAELGKESLPFLTVDNVDQIAELDELPGWVGDVNGDEMGVGELGLGYLKEVHAINRKKKYKAYEPVRRGWWWIDFKIDKLFSSGGFRKTRASDKARWMRARAAWLGSKMEDRGLL